MPLDPTAVTLVPAVAATPGTQPDGPDTYGLGNAPKAPTFIYRFTIPGTADYTDTGYETFSTTLMESAELQRPRAEILDVRGHLIAAGGGVTAFVRYDADADTLLLHATADGAVLATADISASTLHLTVIAG